MKTVKRLLCFILSACLICIPSFAFGEEGYGTIVKDYEFISSDKDSPSYDASKTITEGENEYEHTYITYEVIKEIEPNKIEREVSINNLEDFKEEIKEKVNGEEVTYKAVEPEWEKTELPRERIIREEYRTYGEGDEIPSSIILNGNTYLQSQVSEESSMEPFQTPAYFAATDKENTIYSFNGKFVEIKGSDPYWDGWESDVMEYLNITPQNYIVDSISWNGDFEGEEGNYTREATVTGRQTAYNYVVTYTYDSERDLREEDIEYLYTAKVTYIEEKEPSYEVIAHATYSPVVKEVEPEEVKEEKGLSLAQSIGIGAGVAALAGAGAYLFFFLGKKRKKGEE